MDPHRSRQRSSSRLRLVGARRRGTDGGTDGGETGSSFTGTDAGTEAGTDGGETGSDSTGPDFTGTDAGTGADAGGFGAGIPVNAAFAAVGSMLCRSVYDLPHGVSRVWSK